MMKQRRKLHDRRSVRLKGYDYSQAGAYFVTICTKDRECLFGDVSDGEMVLNELGHIVRHCLDEIPTHFTHVELDQCVVMPNHVHAIVIVTEHTHDHCRDTACRVPTPPPRGSTHHGTRTTEQFSQPVRGSIATIVRSFKSAVTRRVNAIHGTPGDGLWQRRYYEHVIRDEAELRRIRDYVDTNPREWEFDQENPHGSATDKPHTQTSNPS